MRISNDCVITVDRDGINFEAFKDNGLDLLCRLDGIIYGEQIVIDSIRTPINFKRKGYASDLLFRVHEFFKKPIIPFAVVETEEAQGFWKKMEVLNRAYPPHPLNS